MKTLIYLSVFLIVLNLITAFKNNIGIIDSIKNTLKLLSPLFFFMILILGSKKSDLKVKNVMYKMFKFCVLLAILALVFFEISMNRKVEQWPIYFSNIHTHSYIIAIALVGFAYLIHKSQNKIYLFPFLLFAFFVLYLGYGVRTVLIFYLVSVGAFLYANHQFFKFLVFKLLAFVPLFFLVLYFLSEQLNLNRFSSGRLDMYKEKFDLLGTYNFSELLFGRGFGSDFIKTESWWWDEKGSHSDILTFLIENGLVYVLFFLIILFNLIYIYNKFKINIIYFSLILGYLISSVISNGISTRPLAGYMFFIALAVVYLDDNALTNRNYVRLK